MHRVTYHIRQVPPSDAQPAEGLDLVRLHDDVYEVAHQERRDPETLEWVGVPLPGTAIAAGSHRERYANVPAEHAPAVFRAQVIRSSAPAIPLAMLVSENIAEAEAMLAEHVGNVEGAPFRDLSTTDATLDEARRLVAIPGNGIERQTVPMAAVIIGDVIEADRLIPHRWSGESIH